MTNWVSRNKKSIIRAAFLVPIISVAVISISHVVSWYDLANPISWAIYLSIAVEIAAMSAIAAASAKVKGFSVWFVFIIVTFIQFVGNIFFCYSEIDVTSELFKNWSEMTAPILEAMGSDLTDTVSQRRWLALLEGGLLPLISLTCLHFFIKYGEIDNTEEADTNDDVVSEVISQEDTEVIQEVEADPIEADQSSQSEAQDESPEASSDDSTTLVVAPTVETKPVAKPSQNEYRSRRKVELSDKMKKIIRK